MKQHIMVSQLNELNKDAKEKLAIDINSWNEYKIKEGYLSDREIASEMTIGKMIEILENNKGKTERLEIIAPIGLINEWALWYANGDFPKKYEDKELCDVLWEAVKTII